MNRQNLYRLFIVLGIVLTIIEMDVITRALTAFPVEPVPVVDVVGAVAGVALVILGVFRLRFK